MTAREKLFEFIIKQGKIDGEIINVEKFLNHKISYELYDLIAEDFVKHFSDVCYDKILTVESSGIVLASVISLKTHKDFVFLKKKKPITMQNYYCDKSYSFTKQSETTLYLSKEVINSGDKFLFVDDFYAKGNTYASACKIVENAGCFITCMGVIIDKSNSDNIYSILKLKDLMLNG